MSESLLDFISSDTYLNASSEAKKESVKTFVSTVASNQIAFENSQRKKQNKKRYVPRNELNDRSRIQLGHLQMLGMKHAEGAITTDMFKDLVEISKGEVDDILDAENRGSVANFFVSVGGSIEDTKDSLARGIYNLFDNDEDNNEYLRTKSQLTKTLKPREGVSQKVGGFIGGLLPSAMAAAGTGGSSLIGALGFRIAGFTGLGLQSTAGGINAVEEGQYQKIIHDDYDKLDTADKIGIFGTHAGTDLFAEVLRVGSLGRFFNRSSDVALLKKTNTNLFRATRNGDKEAAAKIVRQQFNRTGSNLKDLGKQATEEFIEEAFVEAWTQTYDALLSPVKEYDQTTLLEGIENTLVAGAAGAVGGGLLGGIAKGFSHAQYQATLDYADEQVNQANRDRQALENVAPRALEAIGKNPEEVIDTFKNQDARDDIDLSAQQAAVSAQRESLETIEQADVLGLPEKDGTTTNSATSTLLNLGDITKTVINGRPVPLGEQPIQSAEQIDPDAFNEEVTIDADVRIERQETANAKVLEEQQRREELLETTKSVIKSQGLHKDTIVHTDPEGVIKHIKATAQEMDDAQLSKATTDYATQLEKTIKTIQGVSSKKIVLVQSGKEGGEKAGFVNHTKDTIFLNIDTLSERSLAGDKDIVIDTVNHELYEQYRREGGVAEGEVTSEAKAFEDSLTDEDIKLILGDTYDETVEDQRAKEAAAELVSLVLKGETFDSQISVSEKTVSGIVQNSNTILEGMTKLAKIVGKNEGINRDLESRSEGEGARGILPDGNLIGADPITLGKAIRNVFDPEGAQANEQAEPLVLEGAALAVAKDIAKRDGSDIFDPSIEVEEGVDRDQKQQEYIEFARWALETTPIGRELLQKAKEKRDKDTDDTTVTENVGAVTTEMKSSLKRLYDKYKNPATMTSKARASVDKQIARHNANKKEGEADITVDATPESSRATEAFEGLQDNFDIETEQLDIALEKAQNAILNAENKEKDIQAEIKDLKKVIKKTEAEFGTTVGKQIKALREWRKKRPPVKSTSRFALKRFQEWEQKKESLEQNILTSQKRRENKIEQAQNTINDLEVALIDRQSDVVNQQRRQEALDKATQRHHDGYEKRTLDNTNIMNNTEQEFLDNDSPYVAEVESILQEKEQSAREELATSEESLQLYADRRQVLSRIRHYLYNTRNSIEFRMLMIERLDIEAGLGIFPTEAQATKDGIDRNASLSLFENMIKEGEELKLKKIQSLTAFRTLPSFSGNASTEAKQYQQLLKMRTDRNLRFPGNRLASSSSAKKYVVALQGSADLLKQIDLPLAQMYRNMDHYQNTIKHGWEQRINPFVTKLAKGSIGKRANRADLKEFMDALIIQGEDGAAIQDRLAAKHGFTEELYEVRDVLGQIYLEVTGAGVEMKQIDNFFPLMVRNIKHFRSVLQKRYDELPESQKPREVDSFDDFVAAKKSAIKLQRETSMSSELGDVIVRDDDPELLARLEEFLHGGRAVKFNRDVQEKDRVAISDLYANPIHALDSYFNKMSKLISHIEYLGSAKSTGIFAGEGIIVKRVAELKKAGHLHGDDIKVIREVVSATNSDASVSQFLGTVNRTTNTLLLFNWFSAIKQSAEIGTQLHQFGKYAWTAMFMKPSDKVSPHDTGIDYESALGRFSSEESVTTALAVAPVPEGNLSVKVGDYAENISRWTTEKAAKWSGFRYMDYAMKTNALTASLLRKQDMTDQQLRDEINLFGEAQSANKSEESMDAYIKAVRAGDATNKDLQEMLNTQLLDIQPAAKSEMPLMNLWDSRSRTITLLRGYALKNLIRISNDVRKNEMMIRLAKADGKPTADLRAKQMYAFTLMTSMAALGEITGEELKNLFAAFFDNDNESTLVAFMNNDSVAGDVVVDKLLDGYLRQFFMSRYLTSRAETEGPFSALINNFAPAFTSIGDNAVRDALDIRKLLQNDIEGVDRSKEFWGDFRSVSYIPLLGAILASSGGDIGGPEMRKARRIRERREDKILGKNGNYFNKVDQKRMESYNRFRNMDTLDDLTDRDWEVYDQIHAYKKARDSIIGEIRPYILQDGDNSGFTLTPAEIRRFARHVRENVEQLSRMSLDEVSEAEGVLASNPFQ